MSLGLLIASAAFAASKNTDDDNKLAAVKSEISQIEEQVHKRAATADIIESEIIEIERILATLKHQQASGTLSLHKNGAYVEELHNRRDQLEQVRLEKHQNLDKILGIRYRLWRQPDLKYLLGNKNFAEIDRLRHYQKYYHRKIIVDLSESQHELAALNDLTRAIKLEINRSKTKDFNLGQEISLLERTLNQHRELVRSLATLENKTTTRMIGLRKAEKDLTLFLEQLSAESAVKIGDEITQSIKVGLPWPTAGEIVSAPGSAMRDGGAKWAGVLIKAPPGHPVKAIADGQVAFADWFKNLGMLIIVDHLDGHLSLYGHNSELKVESGQQVKQNQVIAVVGQTGSIAESALYFEIRKQGLAIDPRLYCEKEP